MEEFILAVNYVLNVVSCSAPPHVDPDLGKAVSVCVCVCEGDGGGMEVLKSTYVGSNPKRGQTISYGSS